MTTADLQSIIELFSYGLTGGIGGGLALFILSLIVNAFYSIANSG